MQNNVSQLSFTTRFNNRTNVLFNEVGIGLPRNHDTNSEETRGIQCKAIWDTGATASVITDAVISQLGLKPIDRTPVVTTQGTKETDVYLVNIYLPNHVVFEEIRVTHGKLSDPFSVLIGMDIIAVGDFAITHPNGKTKMSFSIPASRDLDFVKESNIARVKGGVRKRRRRR